MILTSVLTLLHCFLSSAENSQDLTKWLSELIMWKWQISGRQFGQHFCTAFISATALSVTTTSVVSMLLFSEKKFKNCSTCIRSSRLAMPNATGRPTPLLSSTSRDNSKCLSRVDYTQAHARNSYHFNGNWTTRGLPTRGLDNSRSHRWRQNNENYARKVAGGIRELSSPRLVQYTSCLVRESTSPRVGVSASCPVTILTAILRHRNRTKKVFLVLFLCLFRIYWMTDRVKVLRPTGHQKYIIPEMFPKPISLLDMEKLNPTEQ